MRSSGLEGLLATHAAVAAQKRLVYFVAGLGPKLGAYSAAGKSTYHCTCNTRKGKAHGSDMRSKRLSIVKAPEGSIEAAGGSNDTSDHGIGLLRRGSDHDFGAAAEGTDERRLHQWFQSEPPFRNKKAPAQRAQGLGESGEDPRLDPRQ